MNSQQPIHQFWLAFGKEHGLNGEHIYETCHGCRTFDVIHKWVPELATEENVQGLERNIPVLYGGTAKEIPGAVKLVRAIMDLETDEQRLAVVTSGTFDMASQWFKILGLETPKAFITAESVTKGKPDPEPYLLGRKHVGYESPDDLVLVFEDAPAGATAGLAANCVVIGIASTFSAEEVIGFGADVVVPDLTGVTVGAYNAATDSFEIVFENYVHLSEKFLAKYGDNL